MFRLGLLLACASACALANLLAAARAAAIDSPAGFYYGTDSTGPTARGYSVPYREPVQGGGALGFYVGEATTWTDYSGCTSGRAWNERDFMASRANHLAGRGPGSGMYYYMGGPGVDPSYNGTTVEGFTWGYKQAVYAWYQWQIAYRQSGPGSLPLRILWMDVEPGAVGSGYTNGWNEIATRCGRIKSTYINPAVDRATVDGFWVYIRKHTQAYPGVYSSPAFWDYSFGAYGYIPHTYEWSYESDSGQVNPAPSGWCQFTDFCGVFFGGQRASSPTALMWQWSIAGGDYDQIDTYRW